MKDAFLLVDGNSLMHRAFHALPLMDAGGVYTNAVHGFLLMLLRAIEEEAPRYCAVAFDEHAPTFRHTVYPEYKAGRASTPDELRPQFAIIREVLAAMGLGVLSLAGYEADDILGTMARVCKESGLRALLLTGDRDALQLVSEDVSLIFTRKGISESVKFTPASVKEYFGVTPEQVTDWKGLMGDASDNIPGVPGVGEKTAVKLLAEYGTLDGVLAHAGDIKGKLGEKIRAYTDQARFSRELATIKTDAPVGVRFADCETRALYMGAGEMRKYQLNSIAARVQKLAGEDAPPEPEAVAEQQEWDKLETKEALAAFAASLSGDIAVCISQEALSVTDGRRRAIAVIAQGQQDFLAPSVGMAPEEALTAVAPALARGVIAHDGKKLLHACADIGLPRPTIAFDTMLAAYLHNPQERSYALSQFAREDAAGLFTLAKTQRAALESEGMLSLYEDIELPLLSVLYDMEREGFRADGEALRALGTQWTASAEELKEQIYTLSGVRGFNINSPQQLGKVLFETLSLPAGRKTQRGYSTDADTLESLQDAHPCVPAILAYRQVVKLLSTYIDAMIRKMDASGRIHTTFDQTGTSTGRISSSEPNLQNIPVRTELGREIRRAFIPKDGCLLVDADYSQIELRILAHLSQDPAMCDAFLRGQDVHARTAAEVEGVPIEQVTPAMRSSAKAVNFGLVYGISDFGLARNTGMTRSEAAAFIARYFARYPGVKRFMDDAVAQGREKGYALTLFGRRRQLPELLSSNANLRKFGERAAMNTPIQGTAADIIKLAMVRVHKALADGGFQAKLILQVHDELIIEAPDNEADAVAALLRECMEGAAQLSVPLRADVKVGKSWYETK